MYLKISEHDKDQYFKYGSVQDYADLRDCKVLIFHSNSNGNTRDVSIDFVKDFSDRGYILLTCFPKRAKKYLGFGRFMFEDHDNITFSHYDKDKGLLLNGAGYLSD